MWRSSNLEQGMGSYTSYMKDVTSLRRKTEIGQTSGTHGGTRNAYKIWLANCAEWDKFGDQDEVWIL
jgi:hypothetical protein